MDYVKLIKQILEKVFISILATYIVKLIIAVYKLIKTSKKENDDYIKPSFLEIHNTKWWW